MTKIVSATSEKTVIESRVNLSDGPVGLLWFVGIAGPVVTCMMTNFALMFVDVSAGENALIGLAGAVAGAPIALSAIHTFVVNTEVEEYTNTSVGKWGKVRTALAMLAPFGQKIKTGKRSVTISGKKLSPSLIGGGRSKFNDYGYDDYDDYDYGHSRTSQSAPASHEVETELVFKPFGVYIKQTLFPSATNIWDEAFDSTVAVHQFKTPKGVNARSRDCEYADAPF